MANEIRMPRTSGLVRLLETYLLVRAVSTGFRLHLFKNDVTPTETSVLADFTEANYTGYTSQVIGAFGAAAVVSGREVCVAPTLTFTMGAPGTTNDIYGYYVTDEADGALLWCQRFAGAPYAMAVAGQSLAVTPQLTARSEFT